MTKEELADFMYNWLRDQDMYVEWDSPDVIQIDGRFDLTDLANAIVREWNGQ